MSTQTNPEKKPPQISPLKIEVPAPKPKQSLPTTDLFRRVDFTENAIGFRGGSAKRTGIRLALWTWLSISVDALMMMSMTCLFMIVFSFSMKTSVREIFQFILQDLNLTRFFIVAFLMSFWLYMVFLRGFNGATFGEWACSLRLGQPWQRLQSGYILKVFLRTTVIMATGIVIIPLLSLIFKRDLVGEMIGLKIYSLV